MILRQRLTAIHEHGGFKSALAIIENLKQKGFQTVFAGGCVRDSLLGHPPKDLDLATAAPPEVVEAAFPRTLAVGKAFGTIVVVDGEANFEVTTFRSEGPYKDGRRPDHVEFTGIKQDASRRDFTVNALFYDPLKSEILDFVGGVEDLKCHRLRTVGDPEERFMEDRLRMLRAVRFVSQLGFELDSEARHAIQKLRPHIESVSAERIFNEIKRLLEGRFLKKGLAELQATGLAEWVWPEIQNLNPHQLDNYPVFANWENVFAALMSEAGAQVESRLRAWKAPRESLRRVEDQLRGEQVLVAPNSSRADRARVLGGDLFSEILILASGKTGDPKQIETRIQEFLEIVGPTGQLPHAFVTGQDLIRAGMEPGARMGEILRELFDAQLEGQIRSKDQALERMQRLIKV